MDDYLWLLAGFVLLIGGGDLLIRYAVRVAEALHVSPVLIGVLLLGFGTSAPELVTSIQAATAGSPGIAVGNFVGSNIANVFLVLGFASALTSFSVNEQGVKREGWIMMGSAVFFVVATQFWPLDRVIGGMLLGGLLAYILITIRTAKRVKPIAAGVQDLGAAASGETQPDIASEQDTTTKGHVFVSIILTLVGLAGIIVGSDILVHSAISIAQKLQVSESVIGVSVIAIGTSLPELVTVTIAALKRRADMALGGILGSNIYNTLMIGGVTGLVAPAAIPTDIASYDVYVMLAASAALIIIALTGRRIYRIEGFGLLSAYGLYMYSIWP